MQIQELDNIMAAAFEREVYRVGGSVRDELIGRTSKDADYVVRERPLGEVGAILKRYGKISPLKLRTGHVIGWRFAPPKGDVAEVVLPRKEISTGPGRHDFDIVVDPYITLEEDALRRDFTFNALYKRITGEVRTLVHNERGESIYNIVDPTERGLYDLEHKLICTTHPDSFRDDPLRMLRALRFVACLGFDLSIAAIHQMEKHASTAKALAGQPLDEVTDDGWTIIRKRIGRNANGNMSGTVWDELEKMLSGERVAAAVFMGQAVLGSLFPGFRCRFDELDTAVKVNAPLRVKLAILFKDGGWEAAGGMSNMPKEIKRDVSTLIENPIHPVAGRYPVKARLMRVEFGDDMARDMIGMAACIAAHGRYKQNHLGLLGSMEEARASAAKQGVPASIKELKIGGRDLIDLGVDPRQISRMLRDVLNYVNRNPGASNLSYEGQIKLVQEWIGS